MAFTILRGGRVLDIAAGTAELADILIEDDTIRDIGPSGLAAPEGAALISAERKLIHPGLVNAHTHAHGNLAKGMGDRWTLELLLTAAPWITGNRAPDDIQLTAQLGAVEMVLKGCTACYDLFFEGLPGLNDALPDPLRERVKALRLAPGETTLAAVRAGFKDWSFDRDRVRLALAPTIPHHCS